MAQGLTGNSGVVIRDPDDSSEKAEVQDGNLSIQSKRIESLLSQILLQLREINLSLKLR